LGNVMIEALACGTPVVGTRRGAVAEVVDFGVTGYYRDSVSELAEIVPQAMPLDRGAVREHARRRFQHRRMTDDYLRIYRSLQSTRSAHA